MPTFRQFGPDHLGVLAFTLLASGFLILFSRRIRGVADGAFRRLFALGILGSGASSWIYFGLVRGEAYLPLQLCDLALLLVVGALLGGGRIVTELAFFWGVAGSSQALLTPDLAQGFPSFRWLTFFASHVGVVVGAVYLAARGLLKTDKFSVWRVFGFTNLYLAVIGLVNWQLGTNYAYLARKPEQPSLLDVLGPWPYYLIWCEGIALALFFLAFALARLADRLAGKA